MSENQNYFFASLNTADGFRSHFKSIFDPDEFKAIYILKGGPGCGKSSLMKRVAKEAENKGQIVERFLCSSDPNSLDGIILPRMQTAILDGTSPHLKDPDFPGIVENIINLGSFWDVKKLQCDKRQILELIRGKKQEYQSAYRFLSAFGQMLGEILGFAKKQILEEKMIQNIKVQSNYVFKKHSSGKPKIRNIATICKDGFLELDTYQKNSTRIWIVEDHLFTGHLYLNALKQLAQKENQAYYVSYSPKFPDLPNALYFPDSESCFILGKRDYDTELPQKEYHYINMKRFLKPEELLQGKRKIKFDLTCAEELFLGASNALNRAAKFHEELEQFYVSAMNFQVIDGLQGEIISTIFAE